MESNIRERQIVKVTLAGSVVNILLTAFKFAAGILGRSSAMVADAVHSLSDLATDIVVLVFIRVSSKPEDENHRYGHGKFETLATAIIGIVLFLVGVKLLWSGAEKIIGFYFYGKELRSPGMIALAAALISIFSKEILYRYTVAVGRRHKSQSVIANAWHHRSDALSSIGAALGIGGAILLGPHWNVLDPIAAVLVSALIIKVAIELVIPAINELLEKSLPKDVVAEIEGIINSIEEVSRTHNLRTRNIGNNYAIEAHIRVDGDATVDQSHELTLDIENRLREKYGQATHINLHVEPLERDGTCLNKGECDER